MSFASRLALATVLFLVAPLPGTARAQATCGNAVVEPAEACDDGNTSDGDCCSSACQYEPLNAACRTDDLCYASASAACDGFGSCIPGLLLCPSSPPARVNLRDEAGTKQDRLRWSKTSFAGIEDISATFGDPSGLTRYKLCIYETDPWGMFSTNVLYGLEIPTGEDWSPLKAGGWKYVDSSHAVGEMVKVRVVRVKKKAYTSEGFRAQLFAKGGVLALPGPADAASYFMLDSETGVAISLVNSTGLCGSALFSTYVALQPDINTPTHFKGRNRPYD